METIVVICCLVAIVVCIVVANAAREIAVMKGHADWKYFWYTLFILPVGLALVIALPDLYARPNSSAAATVHDETLPEL